MRYIIDEKVKSIPLIAKIDKSFKIQRQLYVFVNSMIVNTNQNDIFISFRGKIASEKLLILTKQLENL